MVSFSAGPKRVLAQGPQTPPGSARQSLAAERSTGVDREWWPARGAKAGRGPAGERPVPAAGPGLGGPDKTKPNPRGDPRMKGRLSQSEARFTVAIADGQSYPGHHQSLWKRPIRGASRAGGPTRAEFQILGWASCSLVRHLVGVGGSWVSVGRHQWNCCSEPRG